MVGLIKSQFKKFNALRQQQINILKSQHDPIFHQKKLKIIHQSLSVYYNKLYKSNQPNQPYFLKSSHYIDSRERFNVLFDHSYKIKRLYFEKLRKFQITNRKRSYINFLAMQKQLRKYMRISILHWVNILKFRQNRVKKLVNLLKAVLLKANEEPFSRFKYLRENNKFYSNFVIERETFYYNLQDHDFHIQNRNIEKAMEHQNKEEPNKIQFLNLPSQIYHQPLLLTEPSQQTQLQTSVNFTLSSVDNFQNTQYSLSTSKKCFRYRGQLDLKVQRKNYIKQGITQDLNISTTVSYLSVKKYAKPHFSCQFNYSVQPKSQKFDITSKQEPHIISNLQNNQLHQESKHSFISKISDEFAEQQDPKDKQPQEQSLNATNSQQKTSPEQQKRQSIGGSDSADEKFKFALFKALRQQSSSIHTTIDSINLKYYLKFIIQKQTHPLLAAQTLQIMTLNFYILTIQIRYHPYLIICMLNESKVRGQLNIEEYFIKLILYTNDFYYFIDPFFTNLSILILTSKQYIKLVLILIRFPDSLNVGQVQHYTFLLTLKYTQFTSCMAESLRLSALIFQGQSYHHKTSNLFEEKSGQTVDEIEQEIQKLEQRKLKFEGKLTEEAEKRLEKLQRKLDFARHKDAPKPIEQEAVISEDAIYLYGVDYMSTDDIKKYFSKFGESQDVIWINDSSCRVKFESSDIARRAYTASQLSSNSEQHSKLNIGEAMVEQVEGVDPRNFDREIGWKEAFGFTLRNNGRLQRLWIRYATDKDFKSEQTKGENSRYYNIQKKRRDQKMRSNGYHQGTDQGRNHRSDNSSFIKKAIGKQEKFQGNLRDRLRGDKDKGDDDDWIGGPLVLNNQEVNQIQTQNKQDILNPEPEGF
ncbi:splicing rnp complex component [Stylonychia lemnae]|uniref:Splicing rnp complex component n=1 Tax=Stylonychia lemnae TaxID=5949 RepID=A0A078A4R5_STYLE|nr:splicing rnp complex component [Stylonychia lemnae]|eukprot:CDW76543.1 splicing rnp complex component [Stylonychia lemnae]